jgi:hypothetical protein
MQVRLLDLDGSLPLQRKLVSLYQPRIIRAGKWGPRIRLVCGFRRFFQFESALTRLVGHPTDQQAVVTFYGSGDFHHVSLALLRRQPRAFNLLVIDNHPDWMRGLPFLHCGTWLAHAAGLPQVRRIFHVGGDVDFDNFYCWLAPWRLLRSGKITLIPAVRSFRKGRWAGLVNPPLRPQASNAGQRVTSLETRLQELLSPYLRELSGLPLYISLDKDVMTQSKAAVNWDSGHLSLDETRIVLETFLRAAEGNLAGMDIVGDWSAVRVNGVFQRVLSTIEHPDLTVDPFGATKVNEETNLALLETIGEFATETVTGRQFAAVP